MESVESQHLSKIQTTNLHKRAPDKKKVSVIVIQQMFMLDFDFTKIKITEEIIYLKSNSIVN